MTEDAMTTKAKSEAEKTGRERRSSVRVRSQLPCEVEAIKPEAIVELEARILDAAVIESEGVAHDVIDWRDHVEDLRPEMVHVLNEVRALRQQVIEIQRIIERHNQSALDRRWMEINDGGFWMSRDESEAPWSVGDFAKVRIQIPSMHTPEVLAVGRVIRVDEEEDRRGVAFTFCTISEPHRKAIARYALRRERQQARMDRLQFEF